MKKPILSLAVLGLLALGGQAAAVICTIDAVPASTLLLPYFEVDLNNPNGLTTLFSINNASATAILTHVVVFSDLSVPVLDFDVYLTGYDVQSINLRDIIVNGNLPQTASAGQDPTDTISPKGPLSQDINFASCNNILPPLPLDALTIAYVQAALTGNAVGSAFCSGGNCCYGQNIGDNIARGYITVDTVDACSFCEQTTGNTTACPPNPNTGTEFYFGAGGTGVVTNQNVIWGDWFIVNSNENFAEGADLVHIEASATNPATSTAGRYTFYGRYDGWTAIDNREPLATDFATRYLNGGPFSGGTDILCWRDSKVNQSAFACPAATGNPAWFPLGQEGVVAFDEQEHPTTVQTCTHSPCNTPTIIACPAETQRVTVGGASLPTPYSFGWLYLDMNTTVAAAGPNPPVDPAAAQAWIVSTLSQNGHYAVGLDAIQLDSACAAVHLFP
jgi:hypothetical protein